MARAQNPPYPPFPPFPPYPPYPPYPAPQVHISLCGCYKSGATSNHVASFGGETNSDGADPRRDVGRSAGESGGQTSPNGNTTTPTAGSTTEDPKADVSNGNPKPGSGAPARNYPPLVAVSKFRDTITVEIHPNSNALTSDPITVELARGAAVNRWIGLNFAPDRLFGDFMEAWPGQAAPAGRTFSVSDMPRKIGLWREFPLIVHLVAGEIVIPDPALYGGCRLVINWQTTP